jgi:hypothetical protein
VPAAQLIGRLREMVQSLLPVSDDDVGAGQQVGCVQIASGEGALSTFDRIRFEQAACVGVSRLCAARRGAQPARVRTGAFSQ